MATINSLSVASTGEYTEINDKYLPKSRIMRTIECRPCRPDIETDFFLRNEYSEA